MTFLVVGSETKQTSVSFFCLSQIYRKTTYSIFGYIMYNTSFLSEVKIMRAFFNKSDEPSKVNYISLSFLKT